MLTRRNFVGGFASFAGMTVAPSCVLVWPERAKGEVVTAAVMIGLSIISTIAALTNKGGGMGQQFAALNLKLDQILQNQIYALEAIQELQHSITQLEQQIGGLLTEERYKDLSISILDLQTDTTRFLEPIVNLPDDTPLNATKVAEYSRLLSTLGNIVSNTENTMRLTDLGAQKSGLNGIHSLLVLTPALPVLIALLDTYRSLESHFTQLGWEGAEYISASKTLSSALKYLRDYRMEEALAAQVSEAKLAYNDLTTVPHWGAVEKLMPMDEGDLEREETGEKCYRSSVQILTTAMMQLKYNRIQNVVYRYKAQRLPGTKPTEIVYVGIELEDASTWPVHSPFIPIDVQNGVYGGPSPEEIAHCVEELPVVTAPEQDNVPQFSVPDKAALVNAKILDPLLLKLPRYNNAVIYQGQILKMQELMDVLVTGLEKFEQTVRDAPPRNLQSREL